MSAKTKLIHILRELKAHSPFTFAGAVFGVVFVMVFKNADEAVKQGFFKIAHPAHVLLSAMVTAAMFKLHSKYKNFIIILIIGWIGSIGIATLSDIIIPHFLGTKMLGLNIPVHSAMHKLEHKIGHSEETEHSDKDLHHHEHHHSGIHLGFIKHWYIVNPMAIIGVIIAYFWPRTKFPHAGHILISTWASSAYVLMTANTQISVWLAAALAIVLFISVWLPCCVSDIVFPLLFVEGDMSSVHCKHIGHHHHPKGE